MTHGSQISHNTETQALTEHRHARACAHHDARRARARRSTATSHAWRSRTSTATRGPRPTSHAAHTSTTDVSTKPPARMPSSSKPLSHLPRLRQTRNDLWEPMLPQGGDSPYENDGPRRLTIDGRPPRTLGRADLQQCAARSDSRVRVRNKFTARESPSAAGRACVRRPAAPEPSGNPWGDRLSVGRGSGAAICQRDNRRTSASQDRCQHTDRCAACGPNRV
jgi:hypothetical protein